MSKAYYFYLMASYRGALYEGVTNDLTRRAYEHKQKIVDGFTTRYNVTKLVYYEATDSFEAAIEREKQVTGWLRRKKGRAYRIGESILGRPGEGVVRGNTHRPRPFGCGLRVT